MYCIMNFTKGLQRVLRDKQKSNVISKAYAFLTHTSNLLSLYATLKQLN